MKNLILFTFFVGFLHPTFLLQASDKPIPIQKIDSYYTQSHESTRISTEEAEENLKAALNYIKCDYDAKSVKCDPDNDASHKCEFKSSNCRMGTKTSEAAPKSKKYSCPKDFPNYRKPSSHNSPSSRGYTNDFLYICQSKSKESTENFDKRTKESNKSISSGNTK